MNAWIATLLHDVPVAAHALADRALAWAFPGGTDGLGVVVLVLGLQAVLLVLLLAYALVLRARRSIDRRYRQKRFIAWHYLVPAYLANDLGPEFVQHSVKRRDYRLFGEFLRPYLIDVAGTDAQRLSVLLARLGFKAHLRRLLRHRNRWRRAYAAHYCGLIGDHSLAPLVRRALGDRADVVVYQAAEALMRLQDVESIEAVLARMAALSRANRERIGVYLMEFGVHIIPFLIQRLRHQGDPPWLKILMVQALGFHHCVGSTWDIAWLFLHSQDRELRIACVKTLAGLGEPTLLGFFEDLLQSEDPVVQAESARALGQMGGPEHAPALARLLVSQDFWVLKRTVEALARLGLLEAVLAQPRFGADGFSPRAWELIREEQANLDLRNRRGQVA